MKTKAACEATGLTRKTLLFYEEKGLFSPHKTRSNGRDYRDYTQEDIMRLKNIATLRRAWFTIDEIKRMEDTPEDIACIFAAYHAWLRSQKRELNKLLAVADMMELSGVTSMEQLIAGMEAAAANLPLPEMDIHPHFRYLDSLEELPRNVVPQTNFEEDGGSSLAARIILGKPYQMDAFLWSKGMEAAKLERRERIVATSAEHDGRFLRFAKELFMILAVVAGWKLLCECISPPLLREPRWPWVLIGIAAGGIRGLLEVITWKRQQQGWQRELSQRPWPEDIPRNAE